MPTLGRGEGAGGTPTRHNLDSSPDLRIYDIFSLFSKFS
jgi:hypothetical protein